MGQLRERRTRHVHDIGVRTGCGKNDIGPQVVAHQRQDGAQGRGWFVLPSRLPVRRLPSGSQSSPKEGHKTEEPEEQWGRALNGLLRPLPLGLHP
jgi:hypothetical protein